ncbi:MAG: TonB family protein [Pyrinomonadaceae bacterium]
MPLNVRSFCTSVLLVVISFFVINAQTSADVMRERVAKAKAYIAVRNYNAAIYELENIRRETSDPTVNGVINVLLMNSYLEQGDYARAQEFLKELSNSQKINKQGGSANYFTVAGQVVKGARNQLERYRALGLSVSDRTLPIEATVDIQKMRETLEIVVEQSKTLGKDKDKTSNAMALLDEATNVRSTLAKDDYDANRWKNESADARETLASSRSVVVNAVNEPPTTEAGKTEQNRVALNSPTNQNTTVGTKPNLPVLPVPNFSADKLAVNPAQTDKSKPSAETIAKTENPGVAEKTKEETRKTEEVKKPADEEKNPVPAATERRVENSDAEKTPNQTKTETVADNADTPKNNSPIAVGSLIDFATQKPSPVYPATAKSIRMTGVVKVEVVVDEKGQVAEVQKSSGPSLLRGAATDAVRKWKFKPFTRDGEPVKATGFVSFNFTL